MTTGAGIFYDGTTSERHAVTVETVPEGLCVRDHSGTLLADWPYADLQHLSAPDDVLRLGRVNNPVLARLEVHDPAFAAEIDNLAGTVDRTGRAERRARRKVVAWATPAGRTARFPVPSPTACTRSRPTSRTTAPSSSKSWPDST